MQFPEVFTIRFTSFINFTFYLLCFRYFTFSAMGAISDKIDNLSVIRQTLISHEMIQAGDGIILAVSGGPDSVALTHVMVELKEEFDCWLIIAHLDHLIRAESGKEFEFVKDFAESVGIEFYGEHVDVPKIALQKKISVEQAGRIVRYDFLEAARVKFGAQKIATAHNADDVIETLFFRLFQGSSLTGLTGIPFKRGNIIRPLLRLGKSQVLDILTDRNKDYLIDRTNMNIETDRNFIRNRVIPAVLERFPGFRTPILRTIDLVREDEEFLQTLANKSYSQCIHKVGDIFEIDVLKMNSLPASVSSRIVRSVLFDFSGPNTRWSRFQIDGILNALGIPKKYARLKLPHGLTFVKDYGVARISRFKEQITPKYCLRISKPACVQIPESETYIDFKILEAPIARPRSPIDREKVFFDADKILFPFFLRPFEPGDRMIPWGRNNPVKIKKLFIDAKIPHVDRQILPMVLNGSEIIWVSGVKRCAGYGIEANTKHVLEISLLRKV
ncbi:MAG: tRNA lysidine(34) synthetase TilS [Deltaproteobacteria bacterium]|nr:tRNA lysidine(34) synthetase TilS [Deltaproteobacteria bacterium]